eukprot:13676175-Alexandrium_andersonii.AAC.1
MAGHGAAGRPGQRRLRDTCAARPVRTQGGLVIPVPSMVPTPPSAVTSCSSGNPSPAASGPEPGNYLQASSRTP